MNPMDTKDTKSPAVPVHPLSLLPDQEWYAKAREALEFLDLRSTYSIAKELGASTSAINEAFWGANPLPQDNCPNVGSVRVIPAVMIPAIKAQLVHRGHLPRRLSNV